MVLPSADTHLVTFFENVEAFEDLRRLLPSPTSSFDVWGSTLRGGGEEEEVPGGAREGVGGGGLEEEECKLPWRGKSTVSVELHSEMEDLRSSVSRLQRDEESACLEGSRVMNTTRLLEATGVSAAPSFFSSLFSCCSSSSSSMPEQDSGWG